ncbi:Uncharacterised protein [Vibrio cholerae]|uniref:Uncharacterized protein n=1 Tax=Vibrio cholerae TaxID=666 RepID=A0A655VKL1_VIBCL|nr:Uncharacterised protein [Vibrio cholerae]
MAAAKLGILFKQTFLDIETKVVRIIVEFTCFAQWELVHLTVFEQHVIQGFATVLRCFCQQLFRPHFFDFEAF